MKTANLSPALADELGLGASATGVVVVEVGEGAARNFGFQRGDVILAVNGQKIATARDLERATKESSRMWRLNILRGGQQISAMFSG